MNISRGMCTRCREARSRMRMSLPTSRAHCSRRSEAVRASCSRATRDFESPRAGLYTYPDLMVVRGEEKFADDQRDTILNPTLIVEVLSKSTEASDLDSSSLSTGSWILSANMCWSPRGSRASRTFRRQTEGQWVLSEAIGLGAACRFESLDCQILLSDIYHKITFGEEPAG